MQIGVHLGNYSTGNDGARVLELGRMADDLGFDAVWVSDHVVIPSVIDSVYPYHALGKTFTTESAELFYEAIVTLSVLAGTTSQVRLGTSVLVAPQRNPLVLAKQLSTLDDLSGGRLSIGVGAGWMREEYEALDASFGRRWKALEEDIQLFRKVWTERDAGFDGETYSFAPIRMSPKPVTPGGPPITIGGHSPRALRIAGTFADGLHGFRLTPEDASGYLDEMRRHAKEAGRDPSGIGVVLRTNIDRMDSPAAAEPEPWRLVGSPQEIAAQVRRYGEHGVHELVLSVAEGQPRHVQDETMAWVAHDVLPLLR